MGPLLIKPAGMMLFYTGADMGIRPFVVYTVGGFVIAHVKVKKFEHRPAL